MRLFTPRPAFVARARSRSHSAGRTFLVGAGAALIPIVGFYSIAAKHGRLPAPEWFPDLALLGVYALGFLLWLVRPLRLSVHLSAPEVFFVGEGHDNRMRLSPKCAFELGASGLLIVSPERKVFEIRAWKFPNLDLSVLGGRLRELAVTGSLPPEVFLKGLEGFTVKRELVVGRKTPVWLVFYTLGGVALVTWFLWWVL